MNTDPTKRFTVEEIRNHEWYTVIKPSEMEVIVIGKDRVPVIEEFFLRGFLMRYVMDARWWTLPFGVASRLALVMGTAVPVLYHPEMLAALVWFSAVSYLMIKTRSIWDCVVAHGLTNLVLGIYVITSDQWHLL